MADFELVRVKPRDIRYTDLSEAIEEADSMGDPGTAYEVELYDEGGYELSGDRVEAVYLPREDMTGVCGGGDAVWYDGEVEDAVREWLGL